MADKQKNPSRWDIVIAIFLALFGAGGIFAANVPIELPEGVTPETLRFGWDEALVQPNSPDPEFKVVSQAASSAGAKVGLWKFSTQINGGKHFPTFRQQTGDCVSMGMANAVNYLQAVQIGLNGANHEFHPAFQPFIYGISRTAPDIGNGKLGRGAGSVGSWAAKSVEMYGILAADAKGVPQYSGKLADEWGFKGVPDSFLPLAQDFKVRSTARVRSYEEARDANANGYPVTVASNVGFKMQPTLHEGKRFGVQSGSWNHQMAFIGCDDTVTCPDGSKGALYCLNSWGENAHGAPAGDEPPGGFWVSSKVVNRMLGQGDSWAISSFDGFPSQDLDFNVFGSDGPPVDVADWPKPAPFTLPVCHLLGMGDHACQTGGEACLLCALPVALAAWKRRSKPRKGESCNRSCSA